MRLNQPEPQGEEGRGLEDPPLELLQGNGRLQELPPLLVGEVRLHEFLRVRQEIEIVEPCGQKAAGGGDRCLETRLAAAKLNATFSTEKPSPNLLTKLSRCTSTRPAPQQASSRNQWPPRSTAFHRGGALSLGLGRPCSSPSFLTALFFTAVTVLAALSDDSCLLAAGRWSSPSTDSFSEPLGPGGAALRGAPPPTRSRAAAPVTPPGGGFRPPWARFSFCTRVSMMATGLASTTIRFPRSSRSPEAFSWTHPCWGAASG
ncbi:hypothetical protein EYF80_037804 [Liparis tanakae]|uniref:Uncharacterized protein n=1 Tax=Liparis tanakae TaxID=230148 RepID=A0A4Z2GEL6_9TELE|nr:hypothetical protein EYF80_037804 [Liparis tanakae]